MKIKTFNLETQLFKNNIIVRNYAGLGKWGSHSTSRKLLFIANGKQNRKPKLDAMHRSMDCGKPGSNTHLQHLRIGNISEEGAVCKSQRKSAVRLCLLMVA